MTASAHGFLSRENTVAGDGFNRWLVPPAALAIHLCIGMAYGFSVFWLPLSKAVGITAPIACAADLSFWESLFASGCDWKISTLGWMYTLFFVFLGSSAAIWGGWLEHAGPRKAGLVSAVCWCGGLVISSIGVKYHQIWMLWLGSGVIGGIGLGLGYISPVSTLIKWFPDRRGMATGMAIMGFGGGAMVGAPLANNLMTYFKSPTSVGVAETFLAMAAIYFVFMVGGALGYRVPKDGWKPAGWVPPEPASSSMITHRHVHLDVAWKTPQFWFIWGVLCLNVSAGIGVLGMASPMLQEVFGGQLLGNDLKFGELAADQKVQIAAIAAGFTGLLSLFNIGGRFFWASISDKIGRKATYFTFFVLGGALYASAPGSAHSGSIFLFVTSFCIILSMYGGGFATVPAYLADMFGTHMVGAIHGRLLTAWSTAGVIGPVLVNYLREYQLASGVSGPQAYDQTMYILAVLLIGGFLCNLMVKPVLESLYMTDEEVSRNSRVPVQAIREEEGRLADFEDGAEQGKAPAEDAVAAVPASADVPSSLAVLVLSWVAVGLPMGWGLWVTLQKAAILFK